MLFSRCLVAAVLLFVFVDGHPHRKVSHHQALHEFEVFATEEEAIAARDTLNQKEAARAGRDQNAYNFARNGCYEMLAESIPKLTLAFKVILEQTDRYTVCQAACDLAANSRYYRIQTRGEGQDVEYLVEEVLRSCSFIAFLGEKLVEYAASLSGIKIPTSGLGGFTYFAQGAQAMVVPWQSPSPKLNQVIGPKKDIGAWVEDYSGGSPRKFAGHCSEDRVLNAEMDRIVAGQSRVAMWTSARPCPATLRYFYAKAIDQNIGLQMRVLFESDKVHIYNNGRDKRGKKHAKKIKKTLSALAKRGPEAEGER